MSEKIQIQNNNEIISKLKKDYEKIAKKDININTYEIPENMDEEEFKRISQKQIYDINYLNMMIDTEMQHIGNQMRNKINELKVKEEDKKFSEFYRNGLIIIKNKEISVNDFYIREFLDKNHNNDFEIICLDKNINEEIFQSSFEENEKSIIGIYSLKDSKIFYDIYVKLCIDNKIVLDTEERIDEFKNYLKKWTKQRHNMVAEHWEIEE